MQQQATVQSTTIGSTQGTRLWEHEVAESFADTQVGQSVTVKTGPFRGKRYTLIGKLFNRFDKFFFVDPRSERGLFAGQA